MNEIKDAPWIERAERYGDPWYCDYYDDTEDYDEDDFETDDLNS
jgi:hypothetical protein